MLYKRNIFVHVIDLYNDRKISTSLKQLN